MSTTKTRLKFTYSDYDKLIGDAPDYPFFSTKEYNYYAIKDEDTEEMVAKFYDKDSKLVLVGDSQKLNEWLAKNNYSYEAGGSINTDIAVDDEGMWNGAERRVQNLDEMGNVEIIEIDDDGGKIGEPMKVSLASFQKSFAKFPKVIRENINVYGYQTENFDESHMAVNQFRSAMESLSPEYHEALRNCAEMVDKMLSIEKGKRVRGFIYYLINAAYYNAAAGLPINLTEILPTYYVSTKQYERGGKIYQMDPDFIKKKDSYEKGDKVYFKNTYGVFDKTGEVAEVIDDKGTKLYKVDGAAYMADELRPVLHTPIILDNGGSIEENEKRKEIIGYDKFKEVEKKGGYIKTDETKIDNDYESDDVDYKLTKAYKVQYAVKWHDQETNSNPDIETFDTIDEAYKDAQIEGDWWNGTQEHLKRIEPMYKEVWLNSDGHEVEEGEKMNGDQFSETKYGEKFIAQIFSKNKFDNSEIYNKSFGARDDDSRELESTVYHNLGGDLETTFKADNGEIYKIEHSGKGKYSRLSVLDKNGDEIDNVQLRIADHTYNPANNDDAAREGKFISVEIANENKTKGKFHTSYSLQFDGEDTYQDVLDKVRERLSEILENKIEYANGGQVVGEEYAYIIMDDEGGNGWRKALESDFKEKYDHGEFVKDKTGKKHKKDEISYEEVDVVLDKDGNIIAERELSYAKGGKMENIFNIIAVNKKTGEEHIEEYDFSKIDAYTWIRNNKDTMPSYDFKIEKVEEILAKGGIVQNPPQGDNYKQILDKTRRAKPAGWRFTNEGAHKLGLKKDSIPTNAIIKKYKGETFKIKKQEHFFIYEEARIDKSDNSSKDKFGNGGEPAAHLTFEEKVKEVAKTLIGKPVDKKYQREYGKTYTAATARAAATKIAGKIASEE